MEAKLRINFDVAFPGLHCGLVNLDAMDVAGDQQNGLEHDISKVRLSARGEPLGDATAHRLESMAAAKAAAAALPPLAEDYCGPCYGAKGTSAEGAPACCRTCDEVRAAYRTAGWDVAGITGTAEQCIREGRTAEGSGETGAGEPGEGCRISGFMLVNKVAGNFHIAMGETHERGAGHIHQFNPNKLLEFNTSHTIHGLSFGDPYPGIKNPLDSTVAVVPAAVGSGVFMYYIKVIPTAFHGRAGRATAAKAGAAAKAATAAARATGHTVVLTNQYSVSSQFRPVISNGMRQNVLPGVFFVYDISPFAVTVTEHTTPFSELATSLCAILGGVLTAAALLDSAIYAVQKRSPKGGNTAALLAVLGLGGGSSSHAPARLGSPAADHFGSPASSGGAGGHPRTPGSAGGGVPPYNAPLPASPPLPSYAPLPIAAGPPPPTQPYGAEKRND